MSFTNNVINAVTPDILKGSGVTNSDGNYSIQDARIKTDSIILLTLKDWLHSPIIVVSEQVDGFALIRSTNPNVKFNYVIFY